jgi:UDP-glucose 4-epimerase
LTRYLVAGGSGFIGSHVTARLLARADAEVVVYDNLVSGQRWYLDPLREDPRLTVVESDLKDAEALQAAMEGCEHVFHFAANPDIAKAVETPGIDFWDGTLLTNNVLEACRITGARRLTYASGSGVYGDRSDRNADESFGPLEPVSTYGASKLASEAMICAYSHMFEIEGMCFRFANVVGPRQTHGVTYDFVRRLMDDPERLVIWGDGQQSKSYIHVGDVVAAMLTVGDRELGGFGVFNVGTDDYVTVREIADMVVERLGLRDVDYAFTGGRRGWKGDVPVVRFDSTRIRGLGWDNRYNAREALADSIDATIEQARRERARV